MSESSAFDRADIEQALRQLKGQSNGLTVEQFAASRRKSVQTHVAVGKTDPSPVTRVPENRVTTPAVVSGVLPWRTITLGLHKTPAAYSAALRKTGFRIEADTDDILSKVSIATQPTDVALVRCSVANLGFTYATRHYDICARAQEHGLELCPAEVGPTLRLAYGNQEKYDRLRIAMEPMIDDRRKPHNFLLTGQSTGQWLVAEIYDRISIFLPTNWFVFSLPTASINP